MKRSKTLGAISFFFFCKLEHSCLGAMRGVNPDGQEFRNSVRMLLSVNAK